MCFHNKIFFFKNHFYFGQKKNPPEVELQGEKKPNIKITERRCRLRLCLY